MEYINQSHIIFGIIAFIILLLGIVLIKKSEYNKVDIFSKLFRLLVFVILPLANIIISRYVIFGVTSISTIILVVVLLSMIIVTISVKSDFIPEILGFFIFIPTLISAGLLFFFIYSSIWIDSQDKVVSEVSSIDIQITVANIKSGFKQLENSISNETEKIDKIMTQLSNKIDEKSRELESIKVKEKDLINEIENYKIISNLSKNEADAIIKVFNKDKYKDYIIGFIIGLLSSVLVSIFDPRRIDVFKKKSKLPLRSTEAITKKQK